MTETECYAEALREFDTTRNEPLWIRAQIETDQEFEKARLRYIELRAIELMGLNEPESNDSGAYRQVLTTNPASEIIDDGSTIQKPSQQNLEKNGWIYLSRSQAEKLPYFGIGGWAYLLIIGLILGPLKNLSAFYSGESVDLDMLDQLGLLQWYMVEQIFVWGTAAANWVLVFGLITKKYWFSQTFIYVWLVSLGMWLVDNAVVFIALRDISSDILISDIVSAQDITQWLGLLIGGGIWSLYVTRSRRINATTKLRIRSDW